MTTVSSVAVESYPVEAPRGSRTKRARYSWARVSACRKTIADSTPHPSWLGRMRPERKSGNSDAVEPPCAGSCIFQGSYDSSLSS